MKPWKFYVYRFDMGNNCIYIGKGCDKRFELQKKRFKTYSGHIVAYFATEKDALIHEGALIKSLGPAFNKVMNRNPRPWLCALLPESDRDLPYWFEAIGSRQVAARILLLWNWLSISKYGVDVKKLLSFLDPWCEALNGRRA